MAQSIGSTSRNSWHLLPHSIIVHSKCTFPYHFASQPWRTFAMALPHLRFTLPSHPDASQPLHIVFNDDDAPCLEVSLVGDAPPTVQPAALEGKSLSGDLPWMRDDPSMEEDDVWSVGQSGEDACAGVNGLQEEGTRVQQRGHSGLEVRVHDLDADAALYDMERAPGAEAELEVKADKEEITLFWQKHGDELGERETGFLGRSIGQVWRGAAEAREKDGTELLTFETEAWKRSEPLMDEEHTVGEGGMQAFKPQKERQSSSLVKEKSSEATESDTQYQEGNDDGVAGREQSVNRDDRPSGLQGSGDEEERTDFLEEEKAGISDEVNSGTSEEEKTGKVGNEKERNVGKSGQKRKSDNNGETVVRKAKKKNINVWAKTSSRKGGKKNSSRNGSQQNKNGLQQNVAREDSVYLTPIFKNQDKVEDGPGMPILLSRFHKAEKVELSPDRLSAGSTKGYRMVRATRGVTDGAWYFEITVENLGPTGHTRLGWSTQKGDVQAPVGFDCFSYAYRDVDGSKLHMAVREPYGEGYMEGDVIGFYINLPHGADLAPKPPPVVSYKGQPWIQEAKDEPLKIVPGSEVSFFRNGVYQGVAFKDINAGRYYPAASMYTLPNQPNCTVRFNFGPDFTFPPVDIADRPPPRTMHFAPYCGLDGREIPPEMGVGENLEIGACQSTEAQKLGEALRFESTIS